VEAAGVKLSAANTWTAPQTFQTSVGIGGNLSIAGGNVGFEFAPGEGGKIQATTALLLQPGGGNVFAYGGMTVAGEMTAAKLNAGKLNLTPDVAPASPANGDVWTTATGLSARIAGATQTMANASGYNNFQSPQAINALNLNNSPCLLFSNVGGGTSGILLNRAAGGSLMMGAQEAGFWGFYSGNRSYLFRASDRAFDGAPQAFDMDNNNAASRDVMRLRHSGAIVATGNFLTFADIASATVGKIDAKAKYWGSGANFKHIVDPTTGFTDGDLWTTTAGLFARINGYTQTFAMLSAANTWAASQSFGGGVYTDRIQNKTGNLSGITLNCYYNDVAARINIAGAQNGSEVRFQTGIKTVFPTNPTWALGNTGDPWGNVVSQKLNLRPSSGPATPVDGDVWTTTTGMFIRIAGVTMKVSATPI
jgi:hypothetical protein